MNRPLRVEKHRSIRASPQRVYQLLSRVESLPRFADLWLAADVLERGGGQVVAEFRGYFGGLPVDSVQRISLRPPGRLEFRQVRGTLKALRAEYLIEPEGAGCRLTARVEVEAGIPMLSDSAMRMVVANALERMLFKVRDAAERDLPRLVPAKRPAATPGAGAQGAAAMEPPEAVEPPGEFAPAEVEASLPAAETPAAAPPGEPRRPGRRRRRRRHRRRPGGAPPNRAGPPSAG